MTQNKKQGSYCLTIRDVTHCCSKNLKCLKNVKKTPFAYTFVHETVTEKN